MSDKDTAVADVAPKGESKVKKKAKTKTTAKAEEIVITLKKSGIGKPKDQRATIKGLGFKRLNQSVTRKDTPEIRGMIKKISHLVQVQ